MKISSNRGDMSLLETELSQSQNHTGIIHFTEPEVNIKTNLLIKCFFKISFFFQKQQCYGLNRQFHVYFIKNINYGMVSIERDL